MLHKEQSAATACVVRPAVPGGHAASHKFFILALVVAMLLSLLVAAPVAAQEETAGVLGGQEAGCAPFDDLQLDTTFGAGSPINSGQLSLRVGQAQSPSSQARIIADPIAGEEGNVLGIIAVLIGLFSGNQSAEEVRFEYGVAAGPVKLRVNGQEVSLPNLDAFDGQFLGGVRVATGDINGDGIAELRAQGPIAGFFVGAANMWIDNVCVQAAGPLSPLSRDLGDAPDATNHWGMGMTAYPAVAARYPTVFDLAVAPVGPAHLAPGPFHLGLGVTRERNADWGPDADPTNNIIPPVNVANRDGRDDGVNPALIPFADCAKFTFPVRVFISPAAIALVPNGKGYLNLWVDGTRDGDWEDSTQCPSPAGAVTAGREHFVVDFPINVAALGPGLHTIMVASTDPVVWPAANANRPAWLRATLSELPSVKSPAQPIGDGRGPNPPFKTGETEDYLWRPANDPANGPDVQIVKRGLVLHRPSADLESLAPEFRVVWAIEYRNIGTEAATNVTIVDALAGAGVNPATAFVRTAPVVPYSVDVTTATFAANTLQPGDGGRIFIAANLGPALPGPLVNRVQISAAEDVDPRNNQATATARALLPAPRLHQPGNGTTNRNQVRIVGGTMPGTEVDLYIDGAKVATLMEEEGIFTFDTSLEEGRHRVVAIARLGATASSPSNVSEIVVSKVLSWDPLSLRLIHPNGLRQRPTDENGRTDETGWRMLLSPGTNYTLQARLCENTVVEGTITFATQPPVSFVGPNADGLYSAAFTSPAVIEAPLEATINVQCAAAAGQSDGMVDTASVVAGSGTAAQMPQLKIVDALTRQPLQNAQLYLVPTLGWYGCLTCTVAAAGSPELSQASQAATLENTLVSSLQQTPGAESFVFHTIEWTLIARAPGYQPVAHQFSLNFSKIEFNFMLEALPEVGDEVLTVVSIGSDWEPLSTFLVGGQTVRLVNLVTEELALNIVAQPPASAAGVEGQGALQFNTGLLAPGGSVEFVVPSEGTLTISSADDDSLGMALSLSAAAPSIYLPITRK